MNTQIRSLGLLIMACCHFLSIHAQNYSSEINSQAVRRVINDAISWQKDNIPMNQRAIWNVPYRGWADGTFLSAVADWAQYDNSCDFKAWYEKIAREHFGRWDLAR